MDWRVKVELFEAIRREYEFGIGTIVGVAKKLGVHRRMVREAIGSAIPKPRKKTKGGYIERAEPVVLIGDCVPGTFCTSLLSC